LVRAAGEAFLSRPELRAEQRAVLRAIAACRTRALGGHVEECDACGYSAIAYNSCRNRHCPKCQGQAQLDWIEQRKARILPTSYYHVVFTLPSELRALALRNRETVYDLLFQCASQTLLELGRDPKWLGARLGVTAVLHTWTRDLSYHPHLHCIVTGGGLSLDGHRWVDGRKGYLVPLAVLGALFRGKILAALTQAYERNELDLDGCASELRDPLAFARLRDALYKMRWIVYVKRPFAGAEQVYTYLGRYTHRVGISNSRLIHFDGRRVTFRTKQRKTVTLSLEEFLRRFILHVLPRGFVKIRHYGLLAPAHATTTLETARRLLEANRRQPPCNSGQTRLDEVHQGEKKASPSEILSDIEGAKRCPRCKRGRLRCYPLDESSQEAEPRAPWDSS
jgi:hypothetical protein